MESQPAKTAPTTRIPKLAPPGAGLPWFELQIARIGFRWLSRRATKKASSALIGKEGTILRGMASRCTEKSGMQRILIDRLRGMEDSSRYWSVFMTLDHLRIVNGAIAKTIDLLAKGERPARIASTAAVKPDPSANAKVIDEFDASCRLLLDTAAPIDNLRTATRYAHPWFGELDAAQWYYLAGFHMRLHQRQVELILRSLRE
jgi:DinB superfamily